LVNFKASNPFGSKVKSWIQQNLIYYAFKKYCVNYFFKISKGLIIKYVLGLLTCWVGPTWIPTPSFSHELTKTSTLWYHFFSSEMGFSLLLSSVTTLSLFLKMVSLFFSHESYVLLKGFKLFMWLLLLLIIDFYTNNFLYNLFFKLNSSVRKHMSAI